MEAFNINQTNLVEIVFFLLPGLVWTLLFYYQLPARKNSDFVLIVLSVVWSSFLIILTTWLYNFINFVTNLQTSLSPTTGYFSATAVVLAVIVSILSARFIKSQPFKVISVKLFDVDGRPFGRLWSDFLKTKADMVVKVIMTNGYAYIGKLRSTSVDPNDEIQEIELWNPLYFDLKTGKSEPIKETEKILIEGSAVATIEKLTDEVSKKVYKNLSIQKKKT